MRLRKRSVSFENNRPMANSNIIINIMRTLFFVTISVRSASAIQLGVGFSRHSPIPRSSSSFGKHNIVGNRMASSLHSPSAIQATNNDGGIDQDSPTVANLLQRAQTLRRNIYGDSNTPSFVHDTSRLSYPSSTYNMETDNTIIRNRNSKTIVQRGFCNWLIPHLLMIGQYPGTTPETNGPTRNESTRHIRNMVQDANISLFCCLQSEVPCQTEEEAWNRDGGGIYLEPYYRREFPRPFTRYGALAQSFANDSNSKRKQPRQQRSLAFLHNPIEDLSVPTCNDSLLSLLSSLLQHLENEHNGNNNTAPNNQPTIYLHCWGGRGRAGLIGSCLASLLFPELSSKEILEWVQRGYDTRAGAESMREGLKRSPQTEQQRWFVREFVALVHTERDKIL